MALNFNLVKKPSTKKIVTDYTFVEGKCKIAKLGEMLTWEMIVDKMLLKGKTISPSLPLIEARILTDKHGVIKEVEASSPSLAPKADQKVIDEFVESMKDSVKRPCISLPMSPVHTGDVITKISKDTFLKMMPLIKANYTMNDEIAYIVQGWSYYKNKKVIVATINETITVELKGIDLQMKFNGYNLFDSETFQILDGYCLLLFNTSDFEGIRISGKILLHHNSEIIE